MLAGAAIGYAKFPAIKRVKHNRIGAGPGSQFLEPSLDYGTLLIFVQNFDFANDFHRTRNVGQRRICQNFAWLWQRWLNKREAPLRRRHYSTARQHEGNRCDDRYADHLLRPPKVPKYFSGRGPSPIQIAVAR